MVVGMSFANPQDFVCLWWGSRKWGNGAGPSTAGVGEYGLTRNFDPICNLNIEQRLSNMLGPRFLMA